MWRVSAYMGWIHGSPGSQQAVGLPYSGLMTKVRLGKGVPQECLLFSKVRGLQGQLYWSETQFQPV